MNITFDSDFENDIYINVFFENDNSNNNILWSGMLGSGVLDSDVSDSANVSLDAVNCDLDEISSGLGKDALMVDNATDNATDNTSDDRNDLSLGNSTSHDENNKNNIKLDTNSGSTNNAKEDSSDSELILEHSSKAGLKSKLKSKFDSKFKSKSKNKLKDKTKEDYKNQDSLEDLSRHVLHDAEQDASQQLVKSSSHEVPAQQASLHTLRFEGILNDFPNGAGNYLKYTKVYDEIIEIRHKILNSHDLTITNSSSLDVASDSNKKSHWKKIEKICIKALSGQTKDLQIIVWFLEAIVYQHEVYYFYEYLSGFLSFIQKFWNVMYPDSNRDFIIEWMDKNIVSAINKTRITIIDDYQVSFSFLDVIIARKLNNVEKMSSIQSLIHKTDMNFYSTLNEHLEKVQEKIHEINNFLKDMSIIHLNSAIDEFMSFVNSVIFEKNQSSANASVSDYGMNGYGPSDSALNEYSVDNLTVNTSSINMNGQDMNKDALKNANDLNNIGDSNDNSIESRAKYDLESNSSSSAGSHSSLASDSKYSANDHNTMNTTNAMNEDFNSINLHINDYLEQKKLQQKKSSLNVGDAILAQYDYWKDKDISKLIFEYQHNPQEMLTIIRFLGMLNNVGDGHSNNASKNIGQRNIASDSMTEVSIGSVQNNNAQEHMKSYGKNFSDVEDYVQDESDISRQDDDLKLDSVTGEYYSEAVSRKGLMDFMKRRGIGKYSNSMNKNMSGKMNIPSNYASDDMGQNDDYE